MPYTHEFGVLDSPNRQASYDTYMPDYFDCVSVDGEWVDEFIDELNQMRTYFHSYDRPGFGLNECGITLIPHESLALFYQVTGLAIGALLTSSYFVTTGRLPFWAESEEEDV